jgi:2-dehydro-3-deoxyphosphooctonate aldolase (KDO 8-P synthase)
MQMMAPAEMGNVIRKCAVFGCADVIVCERGTSFGYGNLIVDPLSFPQLKALGVPVTFDVTHALQLPGALGTPMPNE